MRRTTQLFVELLGIGVVVRLLMFAALRWPLPSDSLSFDTKTLLPLTVLAYVLGIIMDRACRGLFAILLPELPHLELSYQEKEVGPPGEEAQRRIRRKNRLTASCSSASPHRPAHWPASAAAGPCL